MEELPKPQDNLFQMAMSPFAQCVESVRNPFSTESVTGD